MIQTILDFLQEVAARHQGDAVMAWVQFIPAAISGLSSVIGAVSQGRKNRQMRRSRERLINEMNAENESGFNADYYGDYTQRADAQNIIRQMREQFDRQAKRDENTAVITGGTVEAQAAGKEARNRAMSNLYGNLGAMGQQYKDRVKGRYLARKDQIRGMKYEGEQSDLAAQSQSAGTLFGNGLMGLAGMDWAGILGAPKGGGLENIAANAVQGIASANPIKDVSGIKIKNPYLV